MGETACRFEAREVASTAARTNHCRREKLLVSDVSLITASPAAHLGGSSPNTRRRPLLASRPRTAGASPPAYGAACEPQAGPSVHCAPSTAHRLSEATTFNRESHVPGGRIRDEICISGNTEPPGSPLAGLQPLCTRGSIQAGARCGRRSYGAVVARVHKPATRPAGTSRCRAGRP